MKAFVRWEELQRTYSRCVELFTHGPASEWIAMNCETEIPKLQNFCPCGGIILADTEDWKVPRCDQCWLKMGQPVEEPDRGSSECPA